MPTTTLRNGSNLVLAHPVNQSWSDVTVTIPAATNYDALRAVLRTTTLGAAYVP